MKAFYVISAVVLGAVVAAAQTGPAAATKQYDTGALGIAAGQTARFNVFYPTIPAPFASQVMCSATLSISDDQGNVLKSLDVTQLIGGKTASLDLNADTDLPGRTRVEIHARVITPQLGNTGAGCTFVPTLEIFDNTTGKTTAVVKGEVTWPVAQSTTSAIGAGPGFTILNPGN